MLTGLGLLLGGSLLRADLVWDWSYTGSLYAGSGTFTTQSSTTSTTNGFTGYLITDMAGIWNGDSITLLPPRNFGANDNLLGVSPPQLDNNGVSFSTAADHFNIFYSGDYVAFGNVSPGDSGGAFSATAIPEPATKALLATGLGLLAVCVRRHFFRRGHSQKQTAFKG